MNNNINKNNIEKIITEEYKDIIDKKLSRKNIYQNLIIRFHKENTIELKEMLQQYNIDLNNIYYNIMQKKYKDIIEKKFKNEPFTLQKFGNIFNITRERARQIVMKYKLEPNGLTIDFSKKIEEINNLNKLIKSKMISKYTLEELYEKLNRRITRKHIKEIINMNKEKLKNEKTHLFPIFLDKNETKNKTIEEIYDEYNLFIKNYEQATKYTFNKFRQLIYLYDIDYIKTSRTPGKNSNSLNEIRDIYNNTMKKNKLDYKFYTRKEICEIFYNNLQNDYKEKNINTINRFLISKTKYFKTKEVILTNRIAYIINNYKNKINNFENFYKIYQKKFNYTKISLKEFSNIINLYKRVSMINDKNTSVILEKLKTIEQNKKETTKNIETKLTNFIKNHKLNLKLFTSNEIEKIFVKIQKKSFDKNILKSAMENIKTCPNFKTAFENRINYIENKYKINYKNKNFLEKYNIEFPYLTLETKQINILTKYYKNKENITNIKSNINI